METNEKAPAAGFAIILEYDLSRISESRKVLEDAEEMVRAMRPKSRVELRAGRGVIYHRGGKKESIPYQQLASDVVNNKHADHEVVALMNDRGDFIMACILHRGTEMKPMKAHIHHNKEGVENNMRFFVDGHDKGGNRVYRVFLGKNEKEAQKRMELWRKSPEEDWKVFVN